MDKNEVEMRKKRSQRNLAIALTIAAFVVIVYAVTILKLGAAVTEPSF